MLADADDLLLVGTFDTHSGVVDVSDSQVLESWLTEAEDGAVPNLDAQIRPTFPPR